MARHPSRLRRLVPVGLAAVVGAIALAARLTAVNALPVDFDEDDYLRAGQLYSVGFQAGDPLVLLRENYRPEHPPLSKIVTGLALTPLPPFPEVPDAPTTAGPSNDLPDLQLHAARLAQAAFGVATAVLLALVNPLGGLWLALHTWTIKYTSQVMLEAVPAFFALLAVVASARGWVAGGASGSSRRRAAWLAFAAVSFGLACAGKYLYGVAGLAILADWLLRWRAGEVVPAGPGGRGGSAWRTAAIAGWVALAAAAFFAANPYLWPDPVGRLASSIAYHAGYASSEAVQDTGWPMWQPLVWLSGSVPFHPAGTFPVTLDLLISALAVVGLRDLWRRHRVHALWLGIAFLFLVFWPTKWPQYVLVLSAPLCLSAGLATERVLEPVRDRLRRLRDGPAATAAAPRPEPHHRLRDLRTALPWLAPGIVAIVLLGLVPLVYELMLSVTDLQLSSLRDGLAGGVVREAVGGITGQIAAVPFDLRVAPRAVNYVGSDLLGSIQQGVWLGGNTSASFLAFSLLWMVLALACQAALGIAVALLLERPGVRYAAAWRTLFILPWAIPEVVGAVAWQDIVHPQQGLLSKLVGGPVPWNDSPELSLGVLLIAATWMGWPLWMLVATAGLRTIPRSVHEAAELEGAAPWGRFWRITLPLLLPLLSAALVVRGIATFNQFYLFWILNPNGNDYTLPTWTYSMIQGQPNLYSVSAAVNIVTVVALGVIVAWFLRWRGRAERVAFT